MKLCSFSRNDVPSIGVLTGSGNIADIPKCYEVMLKSNGGTGLEKNEKKALPSDMIDLICAGSDGLSSVKQMLDYVEGEGADRCREYIYPIDQIHLHAPVPKPGKLCAVVQNTVPALTNPTTERPDVLIPLYGFTPATAVTGPYDPIEIPIDSGNVGSESELAIIIAKEARYVEPEDAMDYVYGYTVHNDVSGLDIQDKFEWIHNAGDILRVYAGQCKTMDTWSPMGPWLVTKDEVKDPNNLHVCAYVNDVLIQDGNTAEMYHKIPDIISFLSYGHTLLPGDIISWGNIFSRVEGMNAYKADLLGRGGYLITRIDGIGEIRNPIKPTEKVYRHPTKNIKK